ncbi:MAG: hypothetical protein ABR906_01860 [Terracidiphilus sp.]|jgi:hypothetical protein
MKLSYTLLAVVLTASAATRAQDATATTGAPAQAGQPVSGTLHYDLRYSQATQLGNNEGGVEVIFASGDASYANISKRLPFSMQYGGGYSWSWGGQPSTGNVFQHLALSQGVIGHAWKLAASENVSYSFETPTTGFSGVPGTGGSLSGSGSPDQTILSLNSRTVDNTTTVSFTDRLNHAVSLNAGGSWGQLRFIDGNGEDTNTQMAMGGITRRLDARNSISGQYSFLQYSYSGISYTAQTNTLQFGYSRQWNRQFSTAVSAGPMWISSSGTPGAGIAPAPDSTMLSLDASANYVLRRGSASVSYTHGTTGGSGYFLGSKIDNVSANYSRNFGKKLTTEVTGAYMRTASLSALGPFKITGVTNAKFVGGQATRRLGHYMNVFADYTAISQSSNVQISLLNYNSTVLNGVYQVISFGIGYSPRDRRFGK